MAARLGKATTSNWPAQGQQRNAQQTEEHRGECEPPEGLAAVQATSYLQQLYETRIAAIQANSDINTGNGNDRPGNAEDDPTSSGSVISSSDGDNTEPVDDEEDEGISNLSKTELKELIRDVVMDTLDEEDDLNEIIENITNF